MAVAPAAVHPSGEGLPLPREVTGGFGIYVHVPFCAHRCWYCDFNTFAGLDHLADPYMRALARDAREALSAPWTPADRPEVTSIFFGGGTPSRVPVESLVGVLDAIRSAWSVAADAEVTIECNPEDVTAELLEAYRDAGIGRLSFGVQSTSDELLARLGRVHDARTALDAIATARRVGFGRVNADLIFGVPGEDDALWRSSVDDVCAAGATHLSCYGLTYEEGTPLDAWRRLGKVVPVPDDDVARRWELADDLLAGRGFERYEVSNWTSPGEACRHNDLYWTCGEYLGLGAGAHGHLAHAGGSIRSWTVKAPERYIRAIEAGERPVAGSEDLDRGSRAAEVMFLGLRRTEGVSAERFRSLVGLDLETAYGLQLERSAGRGLLRWDGVRARLTRRGTLLANEVLGEFLTAPRP